MDPTPERYALVLAEDDAWQRQWLVRTLERSGRFGIVAAAADGAQALAALAEAGADVDVLLTDLEMPVMDGARLLAAALARRPDLPAVVWSAGSDADRILACLRHGAADYLYKPCAPETLVEVLAAAVARRRKLGAEASGPRVEEDAEGWVTLSAPSRLEYVGRFRDFCEQLWTTALSTEDREAFRYAIDELGGNAVEWGNQFDASKTVRLSYRLAGGRLQLRVRDEGDGFAVSEWRDPSTDLMGHVGRRMASGKRPGGFGIALVRKLMDSVEFNAQGTEVIATRQVTKGEGRPSWREEQIEDALDRR